MQRLQEIEKLPKVYLVSLGCAKNLVDSEVILGRLVKSGFYLCEDCEDSDIIIINTCGFIKEAEDESFNVIKDALELKREGKIKGIIVIGCLPQRYRMSLKEKFNGVNMILGISARDRLPELCYQIINGEKVNTEKDGSFAYQRYDSDQERLRLTPKHFAYLRISEGCSRECSFCVIPYIKGPQRSKPIEKVIEEAWELVDDGAIEINVIGQDTSSYGLDIYGKLMLPVLLDKLSDIEKIKWIRILYTYPTTVGDEIIDRIAQNPKIVKYIDLPIQHTSDKILRLMRRGITKNRQKWLIETLRKRIPNLFIRTSIIVGFPQETTEDFDELIRDIEYFQFERLGAFRYSNEPCASSYNFSCQISEEEKERRFGVVMELQQEIASENSKNLVGKHLDVIIDRKTAKNRFIGRTYGDAPEVDGTIEITSKNCRVGEIYSASIIGVKGYDLIGEINEFTQ
jgi:ribosomal protein S12 methylthiotransferase